MADSPRNPPKNELEPNFERMLEESLSRPGIHEIMKIYEGWPKRKEESGEIPNRSKVDSASRTATTPSKTK